jgi:hypothetical protein
MEQKEGAALDALISRWRELQSTNEQIACNARGFHHPTWPDVVRRHDTIAAVYRDCADDLAAVLATYKET